MVLSLILGLYYVVLLISTRGVGRSNALRQLPKVGQVVGTMGLLKCSVVPTAQLLIMAAVFCVGQVSCQILAIGQEEEGFAQDLAEGCTFETPNIVNSNSEPVGTPLILGVDIHIIGLREVSKSGGSFSVDVE